jgi:hypothetical protein
LQERVTSSRRRILGDEHLDTLAAVSNLAATLREGGQLATARILFERVLAGRRKILGHAHPDTLATLEALRAISPR